MILDLIINIVISIVRGIMVVLPDMQSLPESFNTAWEFFASALGNFIYMLAPGVADIILWTFQTVVVIVLLLFVWWGFVQIWKLIRG